MPVFKIEVIHCDKSGRSVKFKGGAIPTCLQVYISTALTEESEIKKALEKNKGKVVDPYLCPWKCTGKHTFAIIGEDDPKNIPEGSKQVII